MIGAYEVLGDPPKPPRYDQLGAFYRAYPRSGAGPGEFDWSQWMPGAPGGVRVEVGDLGEMFGGGFSEFFNSIFGGMAGGRVETGGRSRGRDGEQAVRISLQEAFQGTTRTGRGGGRRLGGR